MSASNYFPTFALTKEHQTTQLVTNMKRIILAISLAFFACISAFAQKSKTVVWEYPTVGYTINRNFTFTKVEFSKDRTSIYITNQYPSTTWFRLSKDTYIEVDGKRYTIIGSDSIELDKEEYTDSKTWKKDFVLHFPRLPKNVKSFGMFEGMNKGDFKFYAIHPNDVMLPDAPVPAEYLADYPEEDVMPKMKYSEEPAAIHYKALNYKPGMEAQVDVSYLNLETGQHTEKRIDFDDNGCAEFSAKIYYPLEIQSVMSFRPFNPAIKNYGSFSQVLLAPGKEITILVDMLKLQTLTNSNFVGFKGYLAKTNKNYEYPDDSIDATFPEMPDKEIESAKTVEEIKKIHDEYMPKIKEWYGKLNKKYRTIASPIQMEARIFENVARKNPSLFKSQEFRDYILTSRPECFWGEGIELDYEKMQLCSLFEGTDVKGFWPDMCRYLFGVQQANNGKIIERPVIYDENLSKLYDRIVGGQKEEVGKLLASKASNIHLQNEIGDIKPADFISMILEKYKGKTILIDKWETWCAPCRLGHQEMAPMKKEAKYKDVVYVYFSSPSSPLEDWMKATKEIPGEHYYLNENQSRYVANLYESGGVPTYAFYNSKGEKVQSFIGWGGIDVIRNALDEALK